MFAQCLNIYAPLLNKKSLSWARTHLDTLDVMDIKQWVSYLNPIAANHVEKNPHWLISTVIICMSAGML